MDSTHGNTNARGSAGGAASTGGAVYAGSIAAWCAVRLLLGRGAVLPWKLSDRHNIISLACENSTYVDDLVLRLLPQGSVYIQVKHGLKLNAEFNKALAQLVRQFWSPDFSCFNDRLVIATDSSASSTVRVAVSNVLLACHDLASDAALRDSVTSDATEMAFERLLERFETESKLLGKSPEAIVAGFRNFLDCTHVSVFDTLDELQINHVIDTLGQVVSPNQARQAWTQLNATCLDIAIRRTSVDRPVLWDILRRHQIHVSHRRLSLAGMQAQLEDVLAGMTEQRVDQLVALGQFVPDLYVPRLELDQHLEKFRASPSTLMLVSGGSGQGKTCWSAHHGKSSTGRPILLLAAENLEVGDLSLNATLVRLVDRYIREQGGDPLSAVELVQWLNHAMPLIIIDGLDRAPSFSRHLSQWMDASLAQLTQSKLQLVLTGRPETMERLKASLEQSPVVYQPQKGAWQVQLSDFTEEEAYSAASKLGDLALAQYRRPNMMFFCAQIHEHGDVALEEAQIVDRFIDRRVSQVINEYDILGEHLEVFIERLSQTLAGSEQGVLARHEVLEMYGFDKPAYDALRRVNFIVESQGLLRVEPDKVSERLHGRCIDVSQTISDLAQTKAYPLKMGALRFALFDLARRNAKLAVEQMKRLIELSSLEQMDIARSLACSVFAALADWDELEPFAAALAKKYQQRTLFLRFDPDHSLLSLLSSQRWSAEQRVRLLWELSKGESAYDWREKHWLGKNLQPSFHVTYWRETILEALQDPQADSWEFLIARFNSTQPLLDTTEAVMGNIAKALFYISANTMTWEALKALANAEGPDVCQMLRWLARDYSEKVSVLIKQILESGQFDTSHIISLAQGLATLENLSAPNTMAAIRLLQAYESDATVQYICLHALSRGGDLTAAWKVVELSTLESNGDVCLSYYAEAFNALAGRVFDRVLQGEVSPEAIKGFEVSHTHGNLLGADRFVYLEPLLMQMLEQMPESAAIVASVVESFVYEAICASCEWPGLFEIVKKILTSADSHARSTMVYSCTGTDRPKYTVVGQQLRDKILGEFIEHETDQALLRLLVGKLLSSRLDYPQTPKWLAAIMRKHPDLPYTDLAKSWLFGIENPKLEQVLNQARLMVGTAEL